MDFELVKILICGVMGGLIFAQMSGLISTEVKRRTFPNLGIRSSFKNSVKRGLYGALINGLIAGLIFGLADDDVMIFGLAEGFNLGLIGGLISWMFNGGATCIQHFNLRLILDCKGRIPWNYARFLDYASERLLMKKVGGGYIFYHRMLMEHFAQIYQEVSRVPVPVTPRQTSQPVAQANAKTQINSSKISNTVPQPSNLVPNHIVCSNCGHQNQTDGKFCIKCGRRIIKHP